MGIPYQDGNTRSPPLNPEPHRKAGTFECPETNHGTSRLSAWARKSGLWSQGAIGFEIQERAYSPPNGKPHVRSIQVPLFWTGRNPAEIKGVRMHTRDLDEGLPETRYSGHVRPQIRTWCHGLAAHNLSGALVVRARMRAGHIALRQGSDILSEFNAVNCGVPFRALGVAT